MIEVPEESLHRLRQMRDDLEWLIGIVDAEMDRNLPYRHYLVGLRSTLGVVGSLIRNVEHGKVTL